MQSAKFSEIRERLVSSYRSESNDVEDAAGNRAVVHIRGGHRSVRLVEFIDGRRAVSI